MFNCNMQLYLLDYTLEIADGEIKLVEASGINWYELVQMLHDMQDYPK